MATSASYDWALNRDQAILMAYQLINVYDKTETSVSTDDGNFAIKVLNGMLKTWSVGTIKTTKRREGYVFTANDTANYKLGSASGANHCTTSYISTELTSSASSTILAVTSTTGMTAADFIGIELDAGTRQWTTIVSVDSATQVTITTGLTSTASADNTVITYTTKLNRPLDILYGTVIQLKNSNNESQMAPIGHDEYFQLPAKATEGNFPTQFYYHKPLTGVAPYYSTMYVFPRPNEVANIMKIIYVDAIQDMDGATDDFDLPNEWIYPVAVNLACELALPYGKFTEIDKLQPRADDLRKRLEWASSDIESIKFNRE